MPRAALGQKGLENPYFAISRPWGSGWPKRNMPKSCAISGRNLWGGRTFPPKVPLAPGNCVFLFLARALNFSKYPRPRTGPKPSKLPFPTTWGSDRKETWSPETCGKPSRIAWKHFFRFWDPFCSAGQKGACGASLLLPHCLLARRASPTLVV